MKKISDERAWKQLLKKNSKLRELAIKAGVENDFKRVQELNGCFSRDCGTNIVKTEAEKELAKYLFCMTDVDAMNMAYRTRVQMACEAGISINDM